MVVHGMKKHRAAGSAPGVFESHIVDKSVDMLITCSVRSPNQVELTLERAVQDSNDADVAIPYEWAGDTTEVEYVTRSSQNRPLGEER